MIFGENNVHVLRDVTDLIGIRTLILRQYWQPVGTRISQSEIDAQKPGAPGVPGGVLLMGEQTVKERGRFATVWTFQGINGNGNSVTFKNRSNSLDYGFEPGFAQVPIQVHRDFDKMMDEFQGYPSNDGTTVIWPPELAEESKGGLSKNESKGKLNPMFGIQAYFEMEGVYRYRYAERTLPSSLFQGVGFIASGLPGRPPHVGNATASVEGGSYDGSTAVGGGSATEGRNWLKAPPSYQRKGVVFDITEYYWLSRRGGWPEPVYRRGYFKK